LVVAAARYAVPMLPFNGAAVRLPQLATTPF
jgi:hypothetical protein